MPKAPIVISQTSYQFTFLCCLNQGEFLVQVAGADGGLCFLPTHTLQCRFILLDFFICLFLLFGELVELIWVFFFFLCAVIRGSEEFEWNTTPLSVSWRHRGIGVVCIPGDLFFICHMFFGVQYSFLMILSLAFG
jgi:hypothetical protein